MLSRGGKGQPAEIHIHVEVGGREYQRIIKNGIRRFWIASIIDR